jgi:helicase
MLRDALYRSKKAKTNELSYLHAISKTLELRGLYLRKKDYELCMEELYKNEENLLCDVPSQISDPWDFESFLSEMKTALFLRDWIDEHIEESLLERYNLGPGDIRNRVDIAKWLLYSMGEIGRLSRVKKSREVKRLQLRVNHGVKEELLPLVSLRGIGRVRARRLFAHGFKTLEDIKDADVRALSRVELIGKKLAESIKRQAEGKDEKAGNNEETTKEEDQKTLIDF